MDTIASEMYIYYQMQASILFFFSLLLCLMIHLILQVSLGFFLSFSYQFHIHEEKRSFHRDIRKRRRKQEVHSFIFIFFFFSYKIQLSRDAASLLPNVVLHREWERIELLGETSWTRRCREIAVERNESVHCSSSFFSSRERRRRRRRRRMLSAQRSLQAKEKFSLPFHLLVCVCVSFCCFTCTQHDAVDFTFIYLLCLLSLCLLLRSY